MTIRIRPGTAADVPAVTQIYLAAFAKDEMMMGRCHPKRAEYPADFELFYERLFARRYWGDEEQIFHVAVEEEEDKEKEEGPAGRIVAFIWFRRPWTDASRRAAHEGSLTVRGWLKPLVNGARAAGEYLWPCRSADPDLANVFLEMHDEMEKKLDAGDPSPPRRREAWYLSTLGVVPAAQGRGVGGLLVRGALADVIDREGAACWLVGIGGVEPFYERFGFVTIDRANKGALADWYGGAVMMRE